MCVDHFPLRLQPAADATAGPGSAGVEGAADAAADPGGPAAPPRPPLQGSARSPRQVSATTLCPRCSAEYRVLVQSRESFL